MIGDRVDPVRPALEHLDRAGLAVVALALGDDGAYEVAGHGAAHEQHVAAIAQLEPGDAVAAEGERVDAQLQLVAALGLANGGRCRVGGHHVHDRGGRVSSVGRAVVWGTPGGVPSLGMAQHDQRAARVIESALEAIIIADADGVVLSTNAAADLLLGRPGSRLVGARLTDLVTAGEWGSPTPRTAMITGHPDRDAFPVELTVVEVGGDEPLRAAFLREPPPPDGGAANRRPGRWQLDGRSLDGTYSNEFYPVVGVGPGGAPLSSEGIRDLIHPAERHAVDDLLDVLKHQHGEGAEASIETETRLLLPDGTMREIRLRGRVELSESGEPEFSVGVVQDVTGRRNTERELEARYAVTRALRDWVTFDEGVVGLLRRFGTALELPLGSLWTWSETTQRLGCRASWSAPGLDAVEFELATREITYPPQIGAIGLAWESERPVIIPELSAELGSRQAELVARLGLTTALAFPALGAEGTVAVVGFYGTEQLESSERLLQTLDSIGHELGRFLELRRKRLEPQGLTARELQILRHAADGQNGPEIAEQLVISPSTVKTHFENIYEKLGVSDRAAAVAFALRSGLIA